MKKKNGNFASFGIKGWWVIIYCIIVFFCYGTTTTDGMNVLAPVYASNIGVVEGYVYTMAGYAGIIGVIIHILLGQMVKKIGPKKSLFVAMILGAVGLYIESHAMSVASFILGRSLLSGAVMNAAFMCCGVLVANWFPKRKGIVMGYTTWGLNICSICSVAILSALLASLGTIGNTMLIFCVIFVLLGVLALFSLKDDPMEAGQYPDNVSKEQYEKEYDTKGLAESDGGWTTVKLLKTPYLYLVALATGVCNNCTGIVVSNMVGRNIELGMTPTAAIATMSVVAVIGVFGSWAVGVIDEKLGTKKTMFGFAIWYLLGDLCNFAASYTSGTASRMLLYVSIFMIGVGIGGSANFTTSLPTSVFGRHGFGKVNSVLFPIQSVIMNLNFLISGFVRIITGNDLKFIFLAGGIVSLINIPLILLLKDEYKYNSDKKAELTNKCN